MTVAAGAVVGALLFVVSFPLIHRISTGGADGNGAPSVVASSGEDGSITSSSTDGSAPSTSLVALTPPSAGPYVLAKLEDGVLNLSGVVPSGEVLSDILQSAETTYSPFVQSELGTDESLNQVDWMSSAPTVVSLLSLSTKGSALVAEGQVKLSVQVATSADGDRMERALVQETGMPIVVEGIEITNLQAPLLEITGSRSQLSLAGRVPSEEIRAATVSAAVGVYGQFNVTSQLVVDETVHSALWMYDPAKLFQSLFVFPEIEIQVSGGTVTGFVRGGYSFAPNSADAVPESDDVIAFSVDLMARDPSLQMLIEAHTDADGPDDVNQALSQDRADVVYGYYTAAGVSPERITAVGKGETDPLTEDATEEGKARNRRIEVKLSILGGG